MLLSVVNSSVLAWNSVAWLCLCLIDIYVFCLRVFSFTFCNISIWLDFRLARKRWRGKTRLVFCQLPAWFLPAVVMGFVIFTDRITRLCIFVIQMTLLCCCYVMSVACFTSILLHLFYLFVLIILRLKHQNGLNPLFLFP